MKAIRGQRPAFMPWRPPVDAGRTRLARQASITPAIALASETALRRATATATKNVPMDAAVGRRLARRVYPRSGAAVGSVLDMRRIVTRPCASP
jgi:hypothetical protein